MAAERRQKGKQMDKEERKKIHKKISIITLLALIVVIAVMIGGTLMGWLKIWAFQLIACLYLVGYWAATDILEPKLTKLLEGVTEDQKKAYRNMRPWILPDIWEFWYLSSSQAGAAPAMSA